MRSPVGASQPSSLCAAPHKLETGLPLCSVLETCVDRAGKWGLHRTWVPATLVCVLASTRTLGTQTSFWNSVFGLRRDDSGTEGQRVHAWVFRYSHVPAGTPTHRHMHLLEKTQPGRESECALIHLTSDVGSASGFAGGLEETRLGAATEWSIVCAHLRVETQHPDYSPKPTYLLQTAAEPES